MINFSVFQKNIEGVILNSMRTDHKGWWRRATGRGNRVLRGRGWCVRGGVRGRWWGEGRGRL
jgi:hypothetical protein